jgi:16S rRNA (cytidine1402-2'-O)-methyltransferase
MAGTLYLVGTPIGNLADVTERARDTLAAVDLIAAEDTRRTGRLLKAFGIEARMVSLHDANERARTAELLETLREGRDVAVVSDAGMPGLSDPGFHLVRASVEEGIDVRAVPGPSAAIAALVVSGLPTDRFVFEGFLPRRAGERRTRLDSLAREERTIVAFESPNRVNATLQDVLATLGDRRAALVRELTKLHEEVLRGRVSEVRERLREAPPKGEIVLVLEGAHEEHAPDLTAAVAEAGKLVEDGVRKREAASRVARIRGISVNEIYRALIEKR